MTARYLAFLAAIAVLGACATGDATSTAGPADGSNQPPYNPVTVEGPIATPEERAACEAVGGEIRPDGLLRYERCHQYLPDGGQSCRDSSECLGRCVNVGDFVDYGMPVDTGQCTWTNSPFGCFQEVVDGLADHGMCID